MELLGEFKDNYKELISIDETNYSKIYKAFKEDNEYVCLKIIEKNSLKNGDYNFLLEQIKREEEITKLCQSQNIVRLYKKLENEKCIIFEYEYFETDLKEYISENGLGSNELYKNIVKSIVNALYIIHQKGVMHRDIKPNNIFINENNNIIKLGDFGCSIYIKDNKSDPIGTIFYTAPEIIKNLKYDEKCDLWSLGVTLYELYTGELPYGPDTTAFSIKKAIYDEKNFKFENTGKPSLDILFKRLLVINPKNRMTFDELFKYVFNENFMENDDFYINNYKNIYENILIEQKEKQLLMENIKEDSEKKLDYEPENHNQNRETKKNVQKILGLVEGEHLPNIMDFPDINADWEGRYNNIIYYDENIGYMGSINEDTDYFERNTPGAFILCSSIQSLDLIKEEIIRANKKDERITFNIITTGSTFEKIMVYLEQNKDFKKCIINACIYCLNLNKYEPLKKKYNILHDDIYNRQFEVVNFIKMFSAEEIKPFPLTKLITYDDYIEKYKDRHFKISQFYGNLTKETYEKYYEKMKHLIEKESKNKELKKKDQNILFKAFLSFDITKDLKELDKLIIREYTKNTFYGDLNKWLMNSKFNFYEPVAYFTARLMYSLNTYAVENKIHPKKEKIFHRGVQFPYSNLLPYKRAKGKVICLSSFTSTSEDENFAKNFSGRNESREIYKTNLKFSVIFKITNKYKDNWISSGIDIHKVSKYKNEKESLFQPFTFYYVRDVEINIDSFTADISLETVGKYEILEEKIKYGKEIQYNQNENIIEIKN